MRAVAAFSNRTFNALKFNETAALALSESLSATNIGDDASDDDKDSINSDSDSLEVDDKDDVDGSSDSESLDDDSDDIDITNSADTESINSGGTSTDTDCILSTVASTDLQIPSNNVPIILCGDFNSFLEVSSVTADSGFEPSSMCQLLRTGTLARDHPQHPDTWSQRKDMSHESPRLGTLQLPRDQDLLFENAYEMEEFSPFKPLFTTKTDEFQGWIDHVWINRHVQVQGVLRPPVFAMDLQASVKSNSFAPIPNKVCIMCLYFIRHIFHYFNTFFHKFFLCRIIPQIISH